MARVEVVAPLCARELFPMDDVRHVLQGCFPLDLQDRIRPPKAPESPRRNARVLQGV